MEEEFGTEEEKGHKNTTMKGKKKMYCYYFNQGNCMKGELCAFDHIQARDCKFKKNCQKKYCVFNHQIKQRELKHSRDQFPHDQRGDKAKLDDNLRRHKKTEHKTHTFSCKQCNYKASTLFDLKKHCGLRHDVKSVYSCDQCEYNATTQSKLTVHIESNHKRKVLALQLEYLRESINKINETLANILAFDPKV